MPFDGAQNSTLTQLLRLKIAFKQAGPTEWAKENFKIGKSHCVLGWLLASNGFNAHREPMEHLRQQLSMPVARLAQAIDGNYQHLADEGLEVVSNFNDAPFTTYTRVADMIDKAVELETVRSL